MDPVVYSKTRLLETGRFERRVANVYFGVALCRRVRGRGREDEAGVEAERMMQGTSIAFLKKTEVGP